MNQANQLRENVNHNITDFYWKRKSISKNRPKTQSVSVYLTQHHIHSKHLFDQ